MKNFLTLFSLITIILLSGCSEPQMTPKEISELKKETVDLQNDNFFVKQEIVHFPDFHGLGYAGNDNKIYFATHQGLNIYDNGDWYTTKKENNDYMGFFAVQEGFYASGHPGRNTKFRTDPLGIVKSVDGGKNVYSAALLGESDFHTLSASYFGNILYLYNSHPVTTLQETGLYYTTDETKTWKKSGMEGLPEEVYQPDAHPRYVLSAHPTKQEVVMMGTSEGLYISKNYGDKFKKTSIEVPVISIFNTEKDTFLSVWTGEIELIKISQETEEITTFNIPKLKKDDAIQYIAVNPKKEQEIIYNTFMGDVYLTTNNGENWEKIAENKKSIK